LSHLTLFGTAGCHLCEEAEAILCRWLSERGFGYEFETVDIALDKHRISRYGLRIPVLRLEESGAELDWPFTTTELERFLTS
jgi:glutaredoxin